MHYYFMVKVHETKLLETAFEAVTLNQMLCNKVGSIQCKKYLLGTYLGYSLKKKVCA